MPKISNEQIQELLAGVVRGLSLELAKADGKVFANGISTLEIKVRVADLSVEATVSGQQQEKPVRNLPNSNADSCRAVFLQAATSLKPGEHVPANQSEVQVCGPIKKKIKRADAEFKTLVENKNADIVFKDEEKDGSDRVMSRRLQTCLDALAAKVKSEWPGVKLRVTEAWDDLNEHTGNSLHYEGRAADLTIYPIDGEKLGRLANLAVESGLDWVHYENEFHVHVSVKDA